MGDDRLPTVRVKSTRTGQVRLLLPALAVLAIPFGLNRRGILMTEPLLLWALAAGAGFGVVLIGLRILVPSTLTIDADGVTWRMTLGPTRRYSWNDIEKFGVIPPRPPLLDPLIGCSFRPGRRHGPLVRAKWTGYDVTLGSGWELAPAALVELLDQRLRAANQRSAAA